MEIDILTIFPEAFESYLGISILKKAQEKGLIKIRIHNLRQWAKDKHQTIDDRPYGGGPGMIFLIEPIYKALKDLKKKKRFSKKEEKVILFSVKGKPLTQKLLEKLASLKRLILICPHYEGVDERVNRYLVDEEISIGPYILT
ncbi:MAG: tRNA (guanosine(37)-N1)-methyltransferase TrmD, partial [Candidatus Paceibacterota bacterium]